MLVYGASAEGHVCELCGAPTSEIAYFTPRKIRKPDLWLCSPKCMAEYAQILSGASAAFIEAIARGDIPVPGQVSPDDADDNA